MSERQLLATVRQSLMKIARSSGAKFEELEEKFWILYDDKYLVESSLSEALRQSTAVMNISQQYIVDFETETVSLFFLGYSNIRGKNPQREGFVLDKTSKDMRRLMFRGNTFVDVPTKIKEGSYFENIKVGKFRSGNDTFITTGTNLVPKQVFPIGSILDRMNIPQVTCVSAAKNPSRLQEQSTYTDSSDWRMIEGFVNRVSTGIRKDKVPFGVLDITDNSSLESMEILEDGSTKQVKMTGWIDPNLLDFDMGSICKFYGPTSVDDKGKVSMNIMQRVPILFKERKPQ